MQIGMIGLGRMGASMADRLLARGHDVVVNDASAEAVAGMADKGAKGSVDLSAFVSMLDTPRVIWLMLPAGVVDVVLDELRHALGRGDIVIDGGNSYYRDDMRRAASLASDGVDYVDCGTSGGVWGATRGYCLMVGGSDSAVGKIEPLLGDLAPGLDAAPRSPGRSGEPSSAERGYLHCGPSGAGHFVKMVHNGIEYGIMAAYAEGLAVLEGANAGSESHSSDAETAPMREPEYYRFDLDLAEIAELWRRGSVVSSWLLDLTAQALAQSPDLAEFTGRVSDSGEGRWTVEAAIDEGVPSPVLATALMSRFSSQGAAAFSDQVLSAMRFGFGGHLEKGPTGSDSA